MDKKHIIQNQRHILKWVSEVYPQVYLVGGTSLSLIYGHRFSEDLDFFTQKYSPKLHREIAAFIGKKTGRPIRLVDAETRKKYVQMAVYELDLDRSTALKIDIVSDIAPLLEPRNPDGMASVDDIYYRKILAVTGWTAKRSVIGRALAGGRQKTKDLYDLYFLSCKVRLLHEWFPEHFHLADYEQLVAWYLSVPKQRTISELLELSPRADVRGIFRHLDDQIIRKLNERYVTL